MPEGFSAARNYGGSGSSFDQIRDKDLTGGFGAVGEAVGGLPGRLWEAFGRLVAAFWTPPEVLGRALECSVWEMWPFGFGLVLDPLRSLRARL